MALKTKKKRHPKGNPWHLSTGLLVVLGLLSLTTAWSFEKTGQVNRVVSIEWCGGTPKGRIEVSDGALIDLKITRGKGTVQQPDRFTGSQSGPLRLDLTVQGNSVRYGKGGTILTVVTEYQPFSFFLRDVSKAHPIYVPAYAVAVTTGDDNRRFRELEADIRGRGLQTKLQRIESAPEESFEEAARNVRQLQCPTWLGLSRDVRVFEVDVRLEEITPRFHGTPVVLPESQSQPILYHFMMGRGWGVSDKITRRLEDGILPILRASLVDEDITYALTAFVTLETSPLMRSNVRGTHYLVADSYGNGHMLTDEQRAERDALLPAEMNRDEETVLCLRLVAVNTSPVPRYAFFRNIAPNLGRVATGGKAPWSFDSARGFSVFERDRVFAVSRLDDKPLAAEEIAILLDPGDASTLTVYLPHRPISEDRAVELANKSFEEALESCRRYWRGKLATAAQIQLPEERITEMIRAGLLHLDLVAYGLEPEGTLVPTIGRYTAIGTESSPIIQFMDAMGWHHEARRAVTFFLDKQHEDGFIQNFGNYMVETGAALWTMGEHYRLTRDEQWVEQIKPKVIKACDYLLKWRQRNMREDLRGRGYGLLDGKTADPEDPFHSFMLSGYAYLGMSRAAEMLENVDAAAAAKWAHEAEALKADIRRAFAEAMAKSPLIPLADGSWCPTVPPWVEYRGPVALFAEGGKWFSHGTMFTRDSLLGPLYLVFTEALEPDELGSTLLVNFHSDLMTKHNAAFSQPYYSRHPIVNLRRGEVKPFLKAYYNTVASLPDRETYTFWEHYYHASAHKTHEEGWFLMQTRWMLWMEQGDTLKLLSGVPRSYLEDGKNIEIENASSYFGKFSLRVDSELNRGRIRAAVECDTDRAPRRIALRLPHPLGRRATAVQGGKYDSATETVLIEPFSGRAEVTLNFDSGE